jgi:hypothetical protein
MNKKYTAIYPCEAYKDQNRYKCLNQAEIHVPMETGSDYTCYICKDCYDQLTSGRISLGFPMTDSQRSRIINGILNRA